MNNRIHRNEGNHDAVGPTKLRKETSLRRGCSIFKRGRVGCDLADGGPGVRGGAEPELAPVVEPRVERVVRRAGRNEERLQKNWIKVKNRSIAYGPF